MQELETLLTSLVERGRKPWGKDVDKIVVCPKEEFADGRNLFIEVFFSNGFSTYRSFRELVSLESWLWQFAWENEFIKNTEALPDTICGWYIDWDTWYDTIANQDNYEFRLIESALIPEEELAKFLVDNIKIDEH